MGFNPKFESGTAHRIADLNKQVKDGKVTEAELKAELKELKGKGTLTREEEVRRHDLQTREDDNFKKANESKQPPKKPTFGSHV